MSPGRKEYPLNTIPPAQSELFSLLTGGLFLACTGLLFLCIYEWIGGCPLRRRGKSLVLLFLLVPFLSYAAAAARDVSCPFPFPWAFLLPLSLLVFVYSGLEALREYRRQRECLSPLSVKQAVDNLHLALAFGDESGRILLINHRMGELSCALLGRFPVRMQELSRRLDDLQITEEASGEEPSAPLYRFPDGSIWRFALTPLEGEELRGCTQLTGHEVTEFVSGNEHLKQVNQELIRTNERLQEMYERLSERIREQETLNLKIRVHNAIGACLITLSELLEKDCPEDSDKELERLRSAIRYFGGEPSPLKLSEVERLAGEMGVELLIEGEGPGDPEQENLVALAIRECISNCILHAKGDQVSVRFTKEENFKVMITNNGLRPDKPVKEGGGLSSIRRRIEEAGAEMELLYSPCFALLLRFPAS